MFRNARGGVPAIPFPHVTGKAIAVDGGIRPG